MHFTLLLLPLLPACQGFPFFYLSFCLFWLFLFNEVSSLSTSLSLSICRFVCFLVSHPTAEEEPPLPPSKTLILPPATGAGQWAYFACPDVDECADTALNPCAEHAECRNIDTPTPPGLPAPVGLECACLPGYAGDGYTCTPTCDAGTCSLETGVCIAPNTCQCVTGFWGDDCSQSCGCNGHSSCEEVGVCMRCEHNTEGPTCDRCQAGFYGNATRGTREDCRPCLEVCNGHSAECARSLAEAPEGQVCLRCAPEAHASGPFCDECEPGFYRTVSSTSGRIECVPCACNGHGSQCDPLTGLSCTCDPWTHTTTAAANQPCSACASGYVQASESALAFGEPCYAPLALGTTVSNTTLGGVDAQSLHFVVLPEELQAGGAAYAGGVRLHVAVGGSSRVNVVVAGSGALSVLRGDAACVAEDSCLAFACTAAGCEKIVSVEQGLPSGPEGARRRRHVSTTRGDADTLLSTTRDRAENAARPSRAAVAELVLPCHVFDLLSGQLYVSVLVAGEEPSLLLELSLAPLSVSIPQASNVRCAACTDCVLPCTPGYFLDAARPYRCQPCRCNGHGDRCNVLTGASCGLASENCDVVTGARCSCADNTISVRPKEGLQPYEYQCNRCATRATPGVDVTFSGTPVNGRQCYQAVGKLPIQASTSDVATKPAGYFYVVKPDQYTNVNLRVTVDVFEGTVEAYISIDSDLALGGNVRANGSGLGREIALSQGVVQSARISNQRHVFALDDKDFNFATDSFYVSLIVQSPEAVFSVWGQQDLTRIELTVFFNVFFAVFFLLLSVIVIVAKARQRVRGVRRRQEQHHALQAMSRRANAAVHLVMAQDLPQDVQDQCQLEHGLLASGLEGPAHLRFWCQPNPIALQPLAAPPDGSEPLVVGVYMVELPGLATPQLQIGVTLAPSTGTGGRKRKRRKHRVAPTTAVSAL